jgi:asparagine synthase (glutamine-hydrolysing)
MCGIVGFAGDGSLADLEAMMAAVIHRGPDGAGSFRDPRRRVYLGHRRLAVLDRDGGAQPMPNEDGSVQVVFNGEIYNHLELRQQLESKGHRFRSHHSDTEILVHGYEEWGEGLPEKLNGMFAFAIYDQPRGLIYCARDRFGEKPLYYTMTDSLFGFASELTALAKHSMFQAELDWRSLRKYFAYGYIPAPSALLKNTFKLPAGYRLLYRLEDRRLSLRSYWRFLIQPDPRLSERPETELADELRSLLKQAVSRRVIADVPLGAFLSGGIDSSIVLRLMADSQPSTVQSFSIGFREASYDESAFARAAAVSVGSVHRQEIFDLQAARDLMPEVLGNMDEPLGDGSLLPTFLLSRFTRQHVTVALSGDGGDELFAGYDPFQALAAARIYNRLVPRPIHIALGLLAARLPLSMENMSFDFKLRRFLMGLSCPPKLWNPMWLAPLQMHDLASLMGEPIDAEDLYSEAIGLWETSPSQNLVDRTLEFYTALYFQNDILTKVDRAAMMVSLEVRAPFLDNDVVEFVRRLPHTFKLRRGQSKYLLKRAFEGFLPEKILSRRKQGFGIPTAFWLRHMALPPAPVALARCRKSWVEDRWAEHQSGRSDDRLFLWSWMNLVQNRNVPHVQGTA